MSDCSASNCDWVKLTESDYAKVIFKDVGKQYSTLDDIKCCFEISSDICPTLEDYVGLFTVGFKDLNDCIVSKKIFVTNTRKQTVVFNACDLPQKTSNFYQFLYVGEKDVIHGASTPFLLDTPAEDLTTVDEDFLIIPPPDECTISYKHYKKLEEENKLLRESVYEHNMLLERIAKDYESNLKSKDEIIESLKKELDAAASIKDESLEKIAIMTSEMLALRENNLKLFYSLKDHADKLHEQLANALSSKEVLEEEKNLCEKQVHVIMDENAKLRSHIITDDNFLKKQLADHDLMFHALKDSKDLCLEELKYQKSLKLELEALLQSAKEENECLRVKIEKLELDREKDKGLLEYCKLMHIDFEELMNECFIFDERKGFVRRGSSLSAVAATEAVSSSDSDSEACAPKTRNKTDLERKRMYEIINAKVDYLIARIKELEKQVKESGAEKISYHEKNTALQNHIELQTLQIQGLEVEVAKCRKLSEELTDMQSRLSEAADLYKSQYVEIRVLRKLTKKYEKTLQRMNITEIFDETKDNVQQGRSGHSVHRLSTAVHCSDSDTGEHVSKGRIENQCAENSADPCSSVGQCTNVVDQSSVEHIPVINSVPTGSSMKSISSKDDISSDVTLICCPDCPEKIPVVSGNTNFLLDHLNSSHGQQLCPVCGLAFDASLPSKYFKCHVDSHFSSN